MPSQTPTPSSNSPSRYVPDSAQDPCNLQPEWQKPMHCHQWGATDLQGVTFAGVHGKHPYPCIESGGHLQEIEFDIPKSVLVGLGKQKQGHVLQINASEWTPGAANFMWHLPQNDSF